jgi:HD-GYP domain-containing protein (c-di-GMP phosphodiesterase class II)
LARYAGYPTETANLIRQAARYHDIGKLGVDQAILNKPGRLTKQEFELVKKHADIGAKTIANAINILSAAKTIAEQHHERIDGLGYPNRISGDEIHPYARIVAVADVYDALASKRTYKDQWSTGDIIKYMKSQSGLSFDSEIIRLLLAHIDEITEIYK